MFTTILIKEMDFLNETLRSLLSLMGMFLGLLSIIRFYASRMEQKIDRLLDKVEKLENEIDKLTKEKTTEIE